MKVVLDKKTKSINLPYGGQFKENMSLGTNVKGVIRKDNGSFESSGGIVLNADQLDDETNNLMTSGVYGGYYGKYTQTNISVVAPKYSGKDNLYSCCIRRNPNITSTSTWGGLRMTPPSAKMRVKGKKWRISFDYRGYSGGHIMNVYQCYTVGWTTLGIGLPKAWGINISAFDTWEWQHFSYEFTINDTYIDWIPGQNQNAWSSTTQYGTGWFALTYNGYCYRHRSGNAAPTLGVDPETEYVAGGVYDAKYPMTAGYFDVYRQIKVGFGYQAQNARGTHVYLDNVRMTDITNNQTYRFNLTTGNWEFETINAGAHIVALGTAAVGVPRTDNGQDVFSTEGNRKLVVDETEVYNESSNRGIRLTILNDSGMDGLLVEFQGNYDVYGNDADRTSLATKLSGINSSKVWILTSFDAIGINTTLNTQMTNMGSQLFRTEGEADSIIVGTASRSTYSAVGKGQTLIKEDGSKSNDSLYRRKACVDVRVGLYD